MRAASFGQQLIRYQRAVMDAVSAIDQLLEESAV